MYRMTKQAACKQAMVKLAQVRLAINYVLRSRAMEKAAAPQWHQGGMPTAHTNPSMGYVGKAPTPQMGSIADLKKSMRNFGITATRRNKQWVNSGDAIGDAQTAKEQLDMFRQWKNSLSDADRKRWGSVLDKNEARLSDYYNSQNRTAYGANDPAAMYGINGATYAPVNAPAYINQPPANGQEPYYNVGSNFNANYADTTPKGYKPTGPSAGVSSYAE